MNANTTKRQTLKILLLISITLLHMQSKADDNDIDPEIAALHDKIENSSGDPKCADVIKYETAVKQKCAPLRPLRSKCESEKKVEEKKENDRNKKFKELQASLTKEYMSCVRKNPVGTNAKCGPIQEKLIANNNEHVSNLDQSNSNSPTCMKLRDLGFKYSCGDLDFNIPDLKKGCQP